MTILLTLPLASSDVRTSRETFVIADIGKNFIQTQEEQSSEMYAKNAKELIDAATEAGVDAVKFQTHVVDDEQANISVVSPHFTGSDRYSWVERNTRATPLAFWRDIKAHAQKRGITFFSTPMSRLAARKLQEIDVPFWKVGSGDVQDFVLLDELIATNKPIIISSGMVSLKELDEVIRFIRSKGSPLIVLYCVSQYPCPPEHFNLATIEYLQETYPDLVIGFSDHSLGYEVSLAAIKVGARVIEKHFSLSRELWGSDHKVSMTPPEMRAMVRAIRNGEAEPADPTPYYGTKDQELEGATNPYRPYFNKSLVAAIDMEAGTLITKESVCAMRPLLHLKGLPAHEFTRVVGRVMKRPIKRLSPLTEDFLQ